MPATPHRLLRETAGFTGAEKALLICVALGIVVAAGAGIRAGAGRAGTDARRVLEQGAGSVGPGLQGLNFQGAPRAMDEGGPEAQPGPLAPTAAIAAAAAVLAASPAAPAVAATAEPTARLQALMQYRGLIEQRTAEIALLTGAERVSRANGLLEQIEQVSAGVRRGELPDVAHLDPRPVGTGTAALGTFVPPELVAPARRVIALVERPIAGLTAAADAQLEGSLYAAGQDWNARLGVPQYRTQSDNLAAPEATCNVTSLAMILERLGYDRQDVVGAIERELKIRQVRAAGQDPARTDLSQVELLPDAWERAVRPYLDQNNQDTATYRKLRGAPTTEAQRATMAQGYRGAAQMEDLLDFMLSLKGISRYEAAVQGGRIFAALEPRPGQQPTTELVSPSAKLNWDDARTRIQAAIDGGGGAMLSLYHKGAGQDGTHLITIQRLTPTGAIVDDPYGRIRADYNRSRVGDAYADPGRTRGTSPYRNVKHDVADDWRVPQAQGPDTDETRGDSVELSNEVLSRMWNRVTIYRRPTPPAPAAGAS